MYRVIAVIWIDFNDFWKNKIIHYINDLYMAFEVSPEYALVKKAYSKKRLNKVIKDSKKKKQKQQKKKKIVKKKGEENE